MCAWIAWIWSSSPSNHPRPDHAPIVIVIQSERLKHSISPGNQSAKHPDSGCFGISGVVIGSALSKGWRSGPEAFRAGHFLRLDRNRKQRMKSLWHPGYSYSKLFFKNTIKVIRFGPKNFLPQTYSQLWLLIHYINNFLRRPGVRYQQDGNRGETPKTGYIQK